MGAVCGAKSVVYIGAVRTHQIGQVFGELGQIFGFFLAETGVLQQHNIAVLHCGNGGFGIFARHIVVIGKHDGLAKQFGEAHGDGRETEFFLGTVLGLTQMAAQNDPATVLDQLFNGGQSGHDAVVIGDDAVLHGDIEIAADQNVSALYLNIFNCLFAKSAHMHNSPFPAAF